MKLTSNFTKSEFDCESGAPMPDAVLANIRSLALALQVLRDEVKLPIAITSGYRTFGHNARVGGAPNSTHIRGLAADFKVKGISPRAIEAILERLMHEGRIPLGGLKAYSTWIHYDIRGVRARW